MSLATIVIPDVSLSAAGIIRAPDAIKALLPVEAVDHVQRSAASPRVKKNRDLPNSMRKDFCRFIIRHADLHIVLIPTFMG